MYSNEWDTLYNGIPKETPELVWKKITNWETLPFYHLFSINKFMHQDFLKIMYEKIHYYSFYEHLVFMSENKTFPNLNQILVVYFFLCNLSSKKIKNATIILIPLDIPKMLEKSTFSVKNVNSGVCIGFENIIIWRQEEMSKVLCHELVHLLNLDYFDEREKMEKIPSKLFKFKKNVETFPNEATTDTLTLVIMSYLNAKRLNLKPQDVYRTEVEWTCKQMLKIWKVLNKDSIDISADVISYYFLKGILMYKILVEPEFLKYFLHGTVLSNKEKNIKKINEVLTNLSHIESLGKFMLSIKKLDNDKTLKMSYFSV